MNIRKKVGFFGKICLLSILIFMLVPLSSAVPSGGVSYYNFSIMNDLWGSNDATNTGTTSVNTYPTFNNIGNSSPNSSYFDGSDWIDLNIDSDLNSDNVGTFNLWINTNTDQTSYFFTPTNFAGETHSGFLFLADGVWGNTGTVPGFLWVGNGVTGGELYADVAIDDGDWHMITWTTNGSSNMIYVDGLIQVLSVQDGSNVGEWFGDRTDTIDTSGLGGLIRNWGNSLFYTGNVDEVKYYNINLNSTQISNLYNIGAISMPSSNFTVTAYDSFSGSSIDNFSLTIDNINYNTTSGSITTHILNNDTNTYNIIFSGVNLASITYEDVVVSSNYVATLYSYNSVQINAFDSDTGDIIEDFNISLQSGEVYYENSSVDNLTYFPTVLSGEYSVIFTSTNYSVSNYIVTMSEGSYQILNIYASMNATSEDVILTAYDTSSNGILEGVLITQRKILDGSYVVIESKTTDISGRAQFTYFENIPYSFIASKDDYTTKTFQLTPLFDSYTLNMDPSTTTNNDVYNDDVIVTLLDDNFVNGSSWVTYSFLSPLGSLEYYNVEVTLDNGTSYNSGDTVAVGSYINATFTAGSVVFGDSALVTITYKSTLNSGVRGNSRVFLFTTWGEPSGGLESLKADIEVYSPLERIFWLTVLMISLASLFSIFGFASGEYFVFGSVGGIFGVVIGGLIGLVGWLSAGFVIFILLLFILGRLLNDG